MAATDSVDSTTASATREPLIASFKLLEDFMTSLAGERSRDLLRET